MKRRRPQWQPLCTMLSLFTVVIYVSGEGYQGEQMGRRLQTVPPILQPIPPPNEVNVTSAPSVDCGTRCPSPPGEGGGGEPTFAPSQEDPPTPVPTIVIVPEPTIATVPEPSPPSPRPDLIQTPQPVEAQTPQPIEPQTPQPIEPQTPQPVEPQTPQPVEPQTPRPVEPQSSQPVEPQTPRPVEPQTRQPVEPQTPQPVEPQTPQPIEQPVAAPTPAPVVVATPAPTPVPTAVGAPPTTSAPIPQPTQFQLTNPPTSRIEVVPINDFVVTLGFDEPQTGTAQDLAVLTSEVERILDETLTASLNAANTNQDVTLERVDLTVEPQLRRRRANNVFDGERRLRSLQQETVNFLVSGEAVYNVAAGSDVTAEELAFATNTVVATTMNSEETQKALTEEFQNQTASDQLKNTGSVSAQVQAPTSGDENQKPTTVAAVFGFILVGLGVIGLGMYGWAFYKKRRKRRRQRKRDRQRGLSETLNTTNIANTTASMGSMNSSINRSRSPSSKMVVLPPTEFEEDSSSEESESAASSSVESGSAENAVTRAVPDSAVNSVPQESDSESSVSDPYAGIASDSSSKSDFTRELELAASLDRRSWVETQRHQSAMEPNGGYIRYPSQYEVEGVEMQEVSGNGENVGAAVGAAAAGAAVVGVAAVAAKSYPYGDEEDSYDSDNVSVDLNEVKNPDADELLINGDEGVEWTAEGVWSPYDGYTKREEQAAEKSVSSLSDSRMTDSRSGKQQGRGSWMKSWSSIDSFRERRRRDSKDPNAFMKSWSSIDSARDTKSRSPILGSLVEDTEIDEEELMVQAADRGIEVETIESRAQTVSTAGTSNAVRMSPTTSAATEVVVAREAKVEEKQDDDDSVLTQDIVKEVSRLARFVKKYDKKREKKLLKDREREEKTALAIKDSQSFPSVGYDAMSDSLSALRKGPVETSTRRERTALTNPVEETDESERSWSTTSNANRAFDDDDEDSSPVVDDSEIDADDSSEDGDFSETASDSSRLGITPFSVQRVVGKPQTANPIKRSKREDASAPETSRPPVIGKKSNSKDLPPRPNAGSPHEESPEKTHTPVQTVKRTVQRVSSARQKKFAQKNTQEPAPAKQSRDVGLTEDALHELSDGNGPAGVSSPYQQQKGALSVLRKNEAILDTASSHFTDGVTSSQYEQALKAGVVSQQEQRKAYVKRNSFKGTHRVPRDPPAPTLDSPSVQATDEKRSPPGYEPKDASVEMRVPPAQPAPQAQYEADPEERVPWSRPSAPPTESPTAPSQPQPTTQRRASFRPGGFKPTNGSAQNRDSPASRSVSSGTKRAAPETAPLTPRAQETAPAPVSPAMKSPPRRKKKSGNAFNNVVSMFESKPKNPIAPVGENWQFNGATR